MKIKDMKIKYLIIMFFSFLSLVAKAVVVADFTANTTSGCPTLLVVVQDNSTASGTTTIQTWTWQITGPAGFVPLVSATNQISGALTIPGFYTLSLTSCDNNGACDTKVVTNYIEVFDLPTYTYSISPTQGCSPLEACFDFSINPVCGTTSFSSFDVNDGMVYTTEDFCHTYNTAGDYFDFTFTTTNSCGCSVTETITDTISVLQSPTASFSTNQSTSCTSPLNVVFTNTSTTSSGSPTYEWNIPGEVSGATSTNLNHTFTVGAFDVELIVTESNGCSDTTYNPNMISVGNPTANFGTNNTILCTGDNIQFIDSSSGTPTSWLWEVLGTGMTSTAQNPFFSFFSIGTYSIRLTSTYLGGCSDVVTFNNYITVSAPPVNSYTVTDNFSCDTPFTTTFTATSTNSVGSSWRFYGGTPYDYDGPGPVDVTYNNFGTYTIRLSDTSAAGCYRRSYYYGVITVDEITTTITADTLEGCIPLTSHLSATTSSGTITSYNWTLPGSDIGSSNSASPTVIYNTDTCFDVFLNVTNSLGCVDTIEELQLICAGNKPLNGFNFTPSTTCFRADSICFNYTGSGADSLFWNLGGGFAISTNPLDTICHTYDQTIGDFSPFLISYFNGCPSDTTIYIDSLHILGPQALYDFNISNCNDWNTIEFTNNSLEFDSSYWVFEDPSVALGTDTSTKTNPIWVFPAIADTITNYSVRLTVFNDTTGCLDTMTRIISVYPPNAEFTLTDTLGCNSYLVNLNNTSLDPGSGANTQWNIDSTYNWSGAPGTSWISGANIQHYFSDPGIYSIILRNIDSRGCMDTMAMPAKVTVHGTNVGFISNVTSGCLPLTVNYTDTSVAPLSGITKWHWNFGTGNPSDTSNLQNPTFSYINAGVFDLTLNVTDSFGCVNSIYRWNYINVQKPLASFNVSDTFICNFQDITISNSSVGNSLTYDWQFQNATPLAYNTNGNPPNITFNIEGIQNAYLEVTDDLGCTDDTTISISVYNIVADGTASADYSGCANPALLVNFTNNTTNNLDPSSTIWNLGNGFTSNVANPAASYAVPGEYIVTLSVSSLSGCSDNAIIDTIVIEGPWGVFEPISSNNICVCDSSIFRVITMNALTPIFLPGDGPLVPFFPVGILGDSIIDTIKVQYCESGTFSPSLFFNEGTCTYSVPSDPSDIIVVDSLTAEYSFMMSSQCDTSVVCFTDLSSDLINGISGVNSWHWNFGTGNPLDTSNLQNPCYTYNTVGEYTVCLTTTDASTCSATACDTIKIHASPIVGITLSDSSICINETINLFDTTIYGFNAIEDSLFWKFGTGNVNDTSSLKDPSFTFNNDGTFDLIIEIYDNFGCFDKDTNQVLVSPLPNVIASIDTFVCLGDSVAINAVGALAYSWTPNIDLTNNSISNPLSFTNIDREYVVTGTDVFGCVNKDSLLVNVSSIIPNFDTSIVCNGDTLFFTDLSTNNLGTINSWSWSFDDVISGVNNTSSIQNPNHVFNTSGDYDVNLIVGNDKSCQNDTSFTITVRVSPTAIFVADTACFGFASHFSSALSDGGSGNIIKTSWDFGTGNVADTSDIANPTFIYPSSGSFTVCLSIISDELCYSNFSDTCLTVFVDVAPTVIAPIDTFVCVGDSVQLIATGAIAYTWSPDISLTDSLISNPFSFVTSDIEYVVTGVNVNGCTNTDTIEVKSSLLKSNFGNTIACNGDTVFFNDLSTSTFGAVNFWSWNFDDVASGINDTSILQNPNHQYNLSGNYNVDLIVENDKFCIADTTILVTVRVSPTALFIADTVCNGLNTNFNSLMSLDGSGTIIKRSWNFGTGNIADTSNLVSPIFNFSIAGTYNVCLTVFSDEICPTNYSDTCITVVVLALPNANESVADVCLNDTSFFMDLTTLGDGNVISNYWDFGQNVVDNILIPGSNGNTKLMYNTFGNYNIMHIVIDDNTCTDTSTIQARVFDNPISSFTFNDHCLFVSNFYTSTSTDASDGINNINHYFWNFAEGAGFVAGIANQANTFNNVGLHNVSLRVVDNFGCNNTSSQTIDVLNLPVANFTLSDIEVCEGTQIFLDANSSTFATPSVLYYWDTDFNTGIDNTSVLHNFNGNTNSRVMLALKDNDNCVDTLFQNVLVHPYPIASFYTDDACTNIPLNINSTSISSDGAIINYNWLLDNVTISTNSNFVFTPLTVDPFTLQLIIETQFNCIDTSEIKNLLVDSLISPLTVSNDTIICLATELPLFVSSSAYSYNWTPSHLFDDATASETNVLINYSTKVKVLARSEHNYCPDVKDSVRIILVDKPDIEYTANPNPVFKDSTSNIDLIISPFRNNDSIFWETNSTLSVQQQISARANPNVETDYNFSLIYYYDTVMCQLDSFVNIQVLDGCTGEMIYAPNIFTPNNDFKNDYFSISGINIDFLNYFRIYNRWGELVYEKESIELKDGRMLNEDAWNGKHLNGTDCENGVYIIQYQVVCKNGDEINGAGNVTLIR